MTSNVNNLTDVIVERLKNPSIASNILGKNCCNICYKLIHKNQKAMVCCQCKNVNHLKCNEISTKEYEHLQKEFDNNFWTCILCTVSKQSQIFPFTLVTDEILFGTNAIDLPSIVDSLPPLDILS